MLRHLHVWTEEPGEGQLRLKGPAVDGTANTTQVMKSVLAQTKGQDPLDFANICDVDMADLDMLVES